jgi:hypothetical protein
MSLSFFQGNCGPLIIVDDFAVLCHMTELMNSQTLASHAHVDKKILTPGE